jgi:RNase H-like domain found in reverse transcriptase/Reverse transcriptase (RNA-dependent DNA polymerase)/Retroviral aspartyl protease
MGEMDEEVDEEVYPDLKPWSDDSDDGSDDEGDCPGLMPVPDDSEDEGSDAEDGCPGLMPCPDDSDDEASNVGDDCPDLMSISDDSDYEERMNADLDDPIGDMLVSRLDRILTSCQPYPGDSLAVDPTHHEGDNRFVIERWECGIFEIYNRVQGFEAHIHMTRIQWSGFSIGKWYAERCAFNRNLQHPWKVAKQWVSSRKWVNTTMGAPIEGPPPSEGDDDSTGLFELGGLQIDRNKYPSLQRNSAQIKGNSRILPKPVVVKIDINGHPVRALLDSGSLGDFISSTLVDQLSIARDALSTPLSLHLAVQGSRSKVNASATVKLKYQGIDETRALDIINLNNYDVILGTPWMYQHKVCVGFNPARVVVGSDKPLPLKAGIDTKFMVSMLSPEEKKVESVRDELRQYADPICREVSETDLPPLRAINHTIPLIDETKIYPWCPSKCPEIFREQWAEKRDAYLKSGRWEITPAGNTVPMLIIPKVNTNPPELRTVVDLRERNKNTRRMTSPLPDMEGMLRETARHKYRTTLDMKNVYEQIRVVPEHVPRTAVTTPDGNMVSNVVQLGDCNAPATYQSLMNHLFSAFIGRFMDIYLDDIMIYSNTLEEHVQHVKRVIDILEREKLYLSCSKLYFIQPVLKLLGCIIDDNGIRMDPAKVDSVLKWKVPTNRDLLRGFIGSVGYLADDIPNVRIPMGILSSITGDTVPFRWGFTEQRAFNEVKELVHAASNHSRVPLDYSFDAPPIYMVTDGCATGISGVVCQGHDWKTAKIAAFYSAKLNPAQQNYPVHEIEMLAGIETMLHYADILQGVTFQWLTDHKGLTHLLNQKNLSGRQARWLEKISTFTFKVVYIEGSENVVADALSRLYSNDSPGTQRARSEHTYHDVVDEDTSVVASGEEPDVPVLAGIEARVATRRGSRVRRLTEKAAQSALPDGPSDARPASARVSSARVKDRPVTRSPQEGGSRTELPVNEPQVSSRPADNEAIASDLPEGSNEESTPLLTQSNLGIDLLSELQGQYGNDPLF